MPTLSLELSVSEFHLRFQQLDLSAVKCALLASKSDPAWTTEEVDMVEIEYGQFLALTVHYPSLQIIPSIRVDALWHQHILDTRAYGRDCQTLFGHFMHHYPYLGLRDSADRQLLADSFAMTQDLMSSHFPGSHDVGYGADCQGAECQAGEDAPSCSSCRALESYVQSRYGGIDDTALIDA